MRNLSILVTLVLAAAALYLTSARAADTAADTAAIGATAPAFTLDNSDGKPVSLADYKGKTVVLEWINKDCPFVQRHHAAKTMENLADKYKSKDVVWLAINSSSSATNEIDKKTVETFSLSYPVLNDSAGSVGRAYGAKTTPHMFIIDKEGKLAYKGGIDNDPQGTKANRTNYVAQALDELLAGKPVSTPETKPYGCSVKYAK